MDRALASGARGRVFESRRARSLYLALRSRFRFRSLLGSGGRRGAVLLAGAVGQQSWASGPSSHRHGLCAPAANRQEERAGDYAQCPATERRHWLAPLCAPGQTPTRPVQPARPPSSPPPQCRDELLVPGRRDRGAISCTRSSTLSCSGIQTGVIRRVGVASVTPTPVRRRSCGRARHPASND